MDSLDENLDFIDQAEVPVMPTALRFGGIAALLFIFAINANNGDGMASRAC